TSCPGCRWLKVEKAPYVSEVDAEWAAANGTVPSSPAGYDVNLAELGPGNDKIDPGEFRELRGGLQQAMHAIKLPQELAKSFVREVVSGVSGWRAAQAGGVASERAYIQEQQRALVRAVGSTKVTEALHDADLCRQMIRKAAPQFERTLNAAGFFLNARAVVAITQQVARMVE